MSTSDQSAPKTSKLKLGNPPNLKKLGMIIFIALFAITGTYLLLKSFAAPSSYNAAVLADNPVAFWDMTGASATEPDLTGNGNTGTYKGGAPAATTMLNGNRAVVFNGSSQYMTVPSKASLSIPTTKKLTWEAWVRPDALQSPNDSGYGYIDWLGKCANYGPTCEYEARMYSTINSENRCNRFSAYVFNPSAGLGSAADWQPTCGLIRAGQWLHVVGEYQTATTPAGCNAAYPGSIDIWVNGVKWNQGAHAPTGCMSQYRVVPRAGDSPLNIGTMALETWFKGAVGKVAIYNTLLTQAQITAHFTAMTGASPSGSCASSCTIPVPTQIGSPAPDTTKPNVNITAPTNGAVVNGSVTISANATDNIGVTKVEFFDGSNLIGSSTTSPYSYAWNTTSSTPGSHTLSAKAYDAANNSNSSANVSVTVSNTSADTTPPARPAGLASTGQTATSISLSWNASTDNVGVTKYKVYRYGPSVSSAVVTATSFTDTGLAAGTGYSYTVSAIDAAGNESPQSTAISVSTKTAVTPPASTGVTITLTERDRWNSGYCSTAVIKNTGSTAVVGWSVSFTITGRVTSLSNAVWSQSGNKVTANNPSWKTTLKAGETYNDVSFCAATT